MSQTTVERAVKTGECGICGKWTDTVSKIDGAYICSNDCLTEHFIRNSPAYVAWEKKQKRTGGVYLPKRRRW